MSGDLAVQVSLLVDWLLSRRLIPEDYVHLLAGVESKCSEALTFSVSDQATTKLISQHRENLHYLAIKEIYEAITKSPEGQAKSLLGVHLHPGAAKWRAALDAYRRRRLGWASAARFLARQIGYEIPALRKHAGACERQVAECVQRQQELKQQEENAKLRYQEMLEDLGIQGFDPRLELRAHAMNELPRLNQELLALLKLHSEELLEYHRAFAELAAGEPLSEPPLPALAWLTTSKGRLELEELERQVPSLRAARKALGQGPFKGMQGAGASAVPEPPMEAPAEIDWGIELTSSGGAGIQWDVGAELSAAAAEAAPPDPGGIDWSAITLDGLELAAGEDKEPAAEGDPLDILLNFEVREFLHREILELAAFLSARVAELESSSSEDLGPRSAHKSLGEVKALVEVVSKAEELLAGECTQRLTMLWSSDRYLEQQVRRVEVAKSQCHKPLAKRTALDKVRAERLEEARRTGEEAERLRTLSRKVKGDLEAELSAYFRSTVQIVGEMT